MGSRRTVIAGVAASAMWAPLIAKAQSSASFGPRVGSQAPAVPALLDQNSERRTLAALAGPKGILLVFYRSAAWCPFCQAQLIALNQGAAQIEQRGFRLVGLSYDEPSVLKIFADRRAITYPLLSDPRSEVIDRWGLRDPQYPPGNRAHGVPRPIIFAIDRRNVIVASIAEERYQDRPPVDVILRTLDAIRG